MLSAIILSRRSGSDRRPDAYEAPALPTELLRQVRRIISRLRVLSPNAAGASVSLTPASEKEHKNASIFILFERSRSKRLVEPITPATALL